MRPACSVAQGKACAGLAIQAKFTTCEGSKGGSSRGCWRAAALVGAVSSARPAPRTQLPHLHAGVGQARLVLGVAQHALHHPVACRWRQARRRRRRWRRRACRGSRRRAGRSHRVRVAAGLAAQRLHQQAVQRALEEVHCLPCLHSAVTVGGGAAVVVRRPAAAAQGERQAVAA